MERDESSTSLVLLIEDDPGLADLITERLESLPLTLAHVHTAHQALEWLTSNHPNLIILDYSLPDMTAASLLRQLKAETAPPPFIVTTGVGDERIAVAMMKLGARDYLVKDQRFLETLPSVIHRVLREIKTEQQLTETQTTLTRIQSLLVAALSQTPAGIIIADAPEIRPRLANRMAEELLLLPGLGEMTTLPYGRPDGYECYHHDGTRIPLEELPISQAIIQGLACQNLEMRVSRHDGSECWILSNAAPIRDEQGKIIAGITVFTDMTEHKEYEHNRRKFEGQLQQKQKLESLGSLAGGIAHDFNNLLMGIMGNADLAKQSVAHPSPALQSLEEILKAAQSAAELCHQMLAYSGKGQFELRDVDINEIVSEMVQMIEVTAARKGAVRYEFADQLPTIQVDPAQVRQIIVNLIMNAAESLESMNGMITISTGLVECDQNDLAGSYLNEELPEGFYVYLEVADNGCGMEKDAIERIFDPFYTTKFTGRGLGLAAVLGIVRGHKGAIKVHSEVGKGTVFKVFFPVAEEKPIPNPEVPTIWRGNGAVLLVDDEAYVRDVGARMLEWIGFSVFLAEDGLDALDVYQKHREKIVIVLLDMTMPRLGGEECLAALRKAGCNVPVILSSGYNQSDIMPQLTDAGLTRFIQKPYRAEALRTLIREIFESRSS